MNGFFRRVDVGWLITGLIVLFVGGYFFLRNTLGWAIGDLNWDAIWPVFIIAVGLSMLIGVERHARGSH
jgi:cell wall-active antibiotic response 4TMS protein YvqF